MLIPISRIRTLNDAPIRLDRRYVLYWMTASRRTRCNFALQHAVEQANLLDKPLVVLEALRVDYPHASDRFHAFLLDGMRDNGADFAARGVTHHAWIERTSGAGRGLLAALAEDAALVVTDDSPQFFLPRMVAAAARLLTVRLEVVDAVGLLPRSVAARAFATAHAFRTFLQRALPPHLDEMPAAEPLLALQRRELVTIDPAILTQWPRASAALLAGEGLAELPIDHTVAPAEMRGGMHAGREVLATFFGERFHRYLEDRNHPDRDGASGLSPYLHFGHLSAHEVFLALAQAEHWDPGKLSAPNRGAREGWWGMSAAGEAFVDQLLTWRELGHLEAQFTPDYDRFEALPSWALRTLLSHANDPRPTLYSFEHLDRSETHDVLWNAAQRQLVQEGRMHNYLRMLWGKKILEWSPSSQVAMARMFALNDRYALDGRDPNSVAGICWVLGRYDRAWGPERPIYGTIRYMTSANTARKWETKRYVAKFNHVNPPRPAPPAGRSPQPANTPS